MKKEIIAYEKGYLVNKDGSVTSPKGKVIKLQLSNSGYYQFSIKINRKVYHVFVHRLQAFMKFGNKLYEDGIVVRHLNNNKLDNSIDNIEIGTQQDNIYDNAIELRLKSSYLASRKNIKYSDDVVQQIRLDYKKGLGYKFIMNKYNINSKGTLSHIINKRITDLDEHIENKKNIKKEKKYCKYCGTLLKKRKEFCSIKCRDEYHKTQILELDTLIKEYIELKSFSAIAKKYNKNTHTIISWFKCHNFIFKDKESFLKKIEEYLENKK